MNKKLTITLKSDLCIGSGYSFAGIIDSDVVYDECGIPYIPAKRIKGVMRETAEFLKSNNALTVEIDDVFGSRGNDRVKGIVLGNAYIQNYQEIRKEIENTKNINAQDILEKFTRIQAQTKMDDDGIVQDNSLRFTRVVNRYSPINKEELVFEADISFSDSQEDDLRKVVKSVRNIGLKRNRGLGLVKCVLEDRTSEGNKIDNCFQIQDIPETDEVCITYKFTNTSPLMLSSESEMKSEKYIHGSNVLGLLASRYLADSGHKADDVDFKNLFLDGTVKYTNAYPIKGDRIYYPAPEYINKLKKTKKLVNVFAEFTVKKDDPEYNKYYNPADGNQPKKLKGLFADYDGLSAETADVETEIVYHHRKADTLHNEDEQLYSMEVLKPGQHFCGQIYAPKKYAELIKKLLLSAPLTFGKSKSSQYGKCKLESIVCNSVSTEHLFKKDDDIMACFLSDGIFHNGVEYTVYSDEVTNIIKTQLGINGDFLPEKSAISTCLVTGYLGIWNLRKQPVPAVKTGSCISFKLNEDWTMSKNFIGERNIDGCGYIKVMKLPAEYKINENKDDSSVNNGSTDTNYAGNLINGIKADKKIDKLKAIAISDGNSLSMSSSTIGRITLMLKESLAQNKDKGYKAAYGDYEKRINSIKRDNERDEALNFLKKYIGENNNEDPIIIDVSNEKNSEEEIDNSRWGEYLLTILTNQKYMKKGEKDTK